MQHAAQFAPTPYAPPVTHHRETQDVVSMAGEAHLGGTVYDHSALRAVDALDAHTAWLLLSTQLAAQRAALGLDEATLNAVFRSHGTSDEDLRLLAGLRQREASLSRSQVDPSDKR
jgi:hypothetical protein